MLFQKYRRFIECVLLFGVVPPVLAAFKPHGWMYVMLWIAALFAWGWLTRHGYRFRQTWNRAAFTRGLLRMMLYRFVPAALALGLFTLFVIPDRLFSLPLQRPQVWAMVMVLYPLLSVIPQEIIYRSFFFHRYGAVFRTPGAMIVASSLAFGWVHILLLNWVAVVFSGLGGLIFGYTYSRTRSLAAVCFEHALYGCTLFTLGLGYFFYHGQAVH